MQNRQKDEIFRDILTVCNGGSSITKVMFHAYMTHSQARAYLQQLITSGLAEHDSLEKIYYTTPKGIEYLRVIERMTEIFPVAKRNSSKAELFAF